MKNALLTFALVLITIFTHSQVWQNYLPVNKKESDLTFFDYKAAFNKWCKEFRIDNTGYYINSKGDKQKAYGWKQFKRWEIQVDGWYDPFTGRFLLDEINKEIERVYNDAEHSTRNVSGNWTQVAYSEEGSGNNGNGRVNSVFFHPTNPDIFWAGTAWGGAWKTTDHGATWTPISDFTITTGISSIAIPSDYDVSNTIYIGTGDREGATNYGRGILKSSNGGSTWTETALAYTTLQDFYINRLLFVPGSTTEMIACTNWGIYKTEDSWDSYDTLFVCKGMDMEFNPADPDIIYVSTRRKSNFKKCLILRSDDAGVTWDTVFQEYGTRAELAVSPDEPSWVYALIADTTDGLKGIYKSTDNGQTFQLVFNDYNIVDGDCYGEGATGQGGYNLTIAANPNDASTVFIGAINVWKSTDAGESWSPAANGYHDCGVPTNVHVDIHWLDFQYSSDKLFVCSDGGIYYSPNNGSSYTNISGGLQINQPYRISNAQAVNEILMGQQDNGIVLWSETDLDFVSGGDGTDCLINPSDPDHQIFTYNSNDVWYTTDHWASFHKFETTGDTNRSWFKPIAIVPPSTVYFGAFNIWKSTLKGANMTTLWDCPDTTLITNISVAPSDPDVIMFNNSEHLWRSEDGGSTWTNLNAGLPMASGAITNIEIHASNPNVIWLSIGGWNDDYMVLKSIDGGLTWFDFSDGLPSCPWPDLIQNDINLNYDELYAVGYFGVYAKLGDNPWFLFSNGLPHVESYDIDIRYQGLDSKIRTGTHGRGVWESNLFSIDNSMAYVWTGTYSSDWHDNRNWLYMTVPSSVNDVKIPTGCPNNPHVYLSNGICKNLVVDPDVVVTISARRITVLEDAFIDGKIKMLGTGSGIIVTDDLTWGDDAVYENLGTGSFFDVTGNLVFESGCDVDLTGSVTRFKGSTASVLYNHSADCMVGDVSVDKDSYTTLFYDVSSTEDLTINGNFIINSTSKFTQHAEKQLILNGNLDVQGNFYQQNGAVNCQSSGTINFALATSFFNDLIIDPGNFTNVLSNIDIRGNLDIIDGIMNIFDHTVELKGDLETDNMGNMTMTSGKVVFNSSDEQKFNAYLELANVELNKPSDTLRIMGSNVVTFGSFDYTSGNMSLESGSVLHIDELVDDGIWGTYRVKSGATLNITNPTGSVDLNGKLVISGGTVNVYGGNHASYWPGSANAELHLSSGTLDFKDRGIFVLDHPTLTFLDNITGGIIRTSSSFQGDHHSFNPAGGYIELRGEGTAELGHGIGSSFYKIVINKDAAKSLGIYDGQALRDDVDRDGTGYEIAKKKVDKPRYRKSPPPENSRANKVTVWDNLDIDNELNIISGEMDINGKTVNVDAGVEIYGSLTITNANSVLNSGAGITWFPGSSSNISEGLITFITSWQFMNGTNATLTLNNTVKALGTGNSNVYHKDPDACFENFIAGKSSGNVYLDNVSLYPMQVNGNMTVKNGCTLRISAADLVVGGNFLTESTSDVIFNNTGTLQADQCEINNVFNMVNGNTLTTNGMQLLGTLNLTDGGLVNIDDLEMEGTLDINAGSVMVHNSFTQSSTGHLILDGGSFIIDKPYTGSMFGFSGTTDLNGGFFEISYEGIQFGTGAIVNFNGGNLRIGGHFRAIQPNSFQPVLGTVELINTIGTYIECTSGNFFHNLLINKSSGAGACMLAYPTTVNVNLDIQSGELSTLSNGLNVGEDLIIGAAGKLTAGSSSISVGEDWMNNRGTVGFSEGTSSVWLETSQPCQISSETFYNLDLAKDLPFNQYANMVAGSTMTILNKLTIGDGTLRMNNNCTLNLNGDLHLKVGGGLNANATATGTVINCYGNWIDYNDTWSVLIGFASGQSTVNFLGSQAQELTASGGANFYDLVIQKTNSAFTPFNNVTVVNDFSLISGEWRQNATNLTFTFKGDFTVPDASLWLDPVNTVSFNGDASQVLANSGQGLLTFGNMEVNRSVTGNLSVLSDVSCTDMLTISSGQVSVDNYRMMSQNGIDIERDGTLNLFNSVIFALGNDASFHVNGGAANLLGTSSDRVLMTRIDVGYYEILVENGGSISAEHTDFEYINGRGLNIYPDGNIAGSQPFNHCSFQQTESGGILLQVNNSQDLGLWNVDFPANTWSGANNVKKENNAGNLTMIHATGGFAGPAYEDDLYSRIHWPATGIWDGDVSTEWHDKDNWWYNFQVPDNGTDVIIPSGRPNYPILSAQSATINTLKMEAGTSLSVIQNGLTVNNWADIQGAVTIGDHLEDQIDFYADSLVWQAGSSIQSQGKATFWIEKSMFIRQGTNLNMSNGEFRFYGSGESQLICHDVAQVHNVYNAKVPPYSLSFVGDTVAKLTINGTFQNGTNAILKCPSSQEWVFDGPVRNTNFGHFRCQNGTIRLSGSINSTYFRVSPGDYFNNLAIDTLVNLYTTTDYSDTLRVNGNLILDTAPGSTTKLTANAFKIMLRGDFTNNFGSSAFTSGAGQTHQVVFYDPSERQEIRGNTNFMGVLVLNESEEGVHVYDFVNMNSIIVSNPVWSHGTLWIGSANIDDNLAAIHLTDGSSTQINSLIQGGLIHVHGGILTVEDLSQNYVSGSYIIDNGLMTLKQAEYTTTHDLYYAHLEINGGELRFFGGVNLSKWPSIASSTSDITMTGGLFYLQNHSVEIIPGNFSENITGGTIRLPGNFTAGAGVTSFHPAGGIVEMYDDWESTCGFSEPSCWFHDFYVTKSGDGLVVPMNTLRVKNELKINEGLLQADGAPVIVGP